ncbi:MAG TPA: SDR family oxidoreductase [Sphingomonas sp.]|jgi:gluconate 5-dehydrogenase|uniref:SDR family oxidoreductase n=1 Tax=Sphingomonas sp. TaxID=28214 RepID=UPI002EDBB768
MTVTSLFSLHDRVAIVTGGTRGIGHFIATGLGEAGARVFVTARDQAGIDDAVRTLGAKGITAAGIAADLGDGGETSAKQIVDGALAAFGRVDILVNNAGRVFGDGHDGHSPDAWGKVMRLNLDAAHRLAREIADREFIPRRAGKIVFVASIAGFGGARPNLPFFPTAYHASKGGLIALAKMLATEWGRHNINVNALCPGYFPTQLSAGLKDKAQEILTLTPLGRSGAEDDIKGVATFLASEAARHVTGQALAVDGGLTAVVP